MVGRLAATQVAALVETGRYRADDGVHSNIDSKRRDARMGPAETVALATTREKGLRSRIVRQKCVDPLLAPTRSKSDLVTFEQSA
jgi:hypothetical protein